MKPSAWCLQKKTHLTPPLRVCTRCPQQLLCTDSSVQGLPTQIFFVSLSMHVFFCSNCFLVLHIAINFGYLIAGLFFCFFKGVEEYLIGSMVVKNIDTAKSINTQTAYPDTILICHGIDTTVHVHSTDSAAGKTASGSQRHFC